jgi:hypothetical protein
MEELKAKRAAEGQTELDPVGSIQERRVGSPAARPPAEAAEEAGSGALQQRIGQLEEALQRVESQLQLLSPNGKGYAIVERAAPRQPNTEPAGVEVAAAAATSQQTGDATPPPPAWRRWVGTLWQGTKRGSAAAWRVCRSWTMRVHKDPESTPPEAPP